MLRFIICAISILLAMPGCRDNESSRGDPSTSYGQVRITDTNGHYRTVFHTGEEFLISDYITNTTMRRVPCAYTWPPFRFNLTQGDSVISTSMDSWALIVTEDTLEPGQSIGWTWRAPSGFGRDPVVVLRPGLYKVNVISWPDIDLLFVARQKSSIVVIVP